MAARAVLILCLLATGFVTPRAARIGSAEDALAIAEQRSAAVAARQGIDDETIRGLPKVLQAASGLAIALMTAFNEEDPDIEYALENLNLQGWQLVKSLVPKEQLGSEGMTRAKAAWDGSFADLPQVIEKVKASYKTGETEAGLDAVMSMMNLGLRAAAKVDAPQEKYITAIADLASELGAELKSFGHDMGYFGAASSLAQIEAGSQAGRWQPEDLNKLMTTGVGLATTFLAAASEDPPDFGYAISSFKIQGWQMAKIVVPKDVQSGDNFKKAKKAWDEVFKQAPELTEKALAAYKDGDTDKVIDVVTGTLSTGLQAASHVDPTQAKQFNAMATLISGVSKSLLKFAHGIGWLDGTR